MQGEAATGCTGVTHLTAVSARRPCGAPDAFWGRSRGCGDGARGLGRDAARGRES
jgi:hypothetical protein